MRLSWLEARDFRNHAQISLEIPPGLTTVVGPNGRVRYAGCSTHLGHGRSMEGFMGVHFAFAYVLRPEQL